MRAFYCSFGFFFFFFLPLVALKQVGFYHFYFEFVSTGQRGANLTPSTWNRTINCRYCSTKGCFRLSFRFTLDIKHKGKDKKYLRMTMENFLFPVQRDLTIRNLNHLILLKLVTPTGQNDTCQLFPFNYVPSLIKFFTFNKVTCGRI